VSLLHSSDLHNSDLQPFLFDEPVEHVVDSAFDWIEAQIGHASNSTTAHKIKEKTE
jgi:hypothetical protein